jgi:uncharacterized protein YbaR (Trm112 family)
MNRDMLDSLACPDCKGPLGLEVENEVADNIESGHLHCSSCQKTYPISNGVPNFLSQEQQAEVARAIAPRPRPLLEAASLALQDHPFETRLAPMIFISHTSKDKDIATELVSKFRSRGLRVWIDHERIKYGESIPRAIEIGISESACLVVLVSRSFLSSQWCRAEYQPLITKEIQSGNVLVLPIVIEKCELPHFLLSKKYADFSSGIDEKKLDEISAQILEQSPEIQPKQKKPKAESSELVAVLQATLASLSPELLTKQSLNIKEARALLDRVKLLIEQFEEYFDEIADVLVESGINKSLYGSAHNVSEQRILKANRKIQNISNEMRSIYRGVSEKFHLSLQTKDSIERIVGICAQISTAEDFLVINLFDSGLLDKIVPRIHQSHSEVAHPDNLHAPFYMGELGGQMLRDYHLALIELNNYKISLAEVIERLEQGLQSGMR